MTSETHDRYRALERRAERDRARLRRWWRDTEDAVMEQKGKAR